MSSGTVTLPPDVRAHLLALADDEHIVGARHTAWIGLGPFLEEDLAFCSIAQDELGHALALYGMLVDPVEVDHFALLRDPSDYRSCWLVERECSEWSDALVRHWLYDRAEALRWQPLADSRHQPLAALAERARREEEFHLQHALQLMSRIATSQEAPRIADAIGRLLPSAIAMWDGAQPADELRVDDLPARWERDVRGDLETWDLAIDWPGEAAVAAVRDRQLARTARSPDFERLRQDLVRVVTVDPAATW